MSGAGDSGRETPKPDLDVMLTRSQEDLLRSGVVPAGAGRELKPDDVFAGRYRIIAKVGEGGTGIVYRAFDQVTKHELALKLIRADRVASAEARARLVQEAVLAREIRHRNVVSVYDAGEFEGQSYFTMEFLSGVSLRAWMWEQLRKGADCPLAAAVDIVSAILDGLEAAHAMGVTHRDLKPENVYLVSPPSEGGVRLKLLDFGLALPAGQQMDSKGAKGTPLYMAPEQINAPDTAKPSADLYSLSKMFYEMLAGVLPQDTWQPPSDGRTDVPKGVDELIRRGISIIPRSRPQSVAEYRAALQQAMDTPESRKVRADRELQARGGAAMRQHAEALYRGGEGDPAGFPEARRWFLEAAQAGDASAMVGIGDMLWQGHGGPRDESGSRSWMEKAAAAGHPHGMYVYAGMLLMGSAGGAKDEAKAREIWGKAAEAGHAGAMLEYGRLHEFGKGGPKDNQAAFAWYRKAAAAGDKAAVDYVKRLDEELKKIEAMKAHNQALTLFNGADIKTDPVKARDLFRSAAESGLAASMLNYGYMLEAGAGGSKDEAAARDWFRKAAENGSAQGMVIYADRLRAGAGGPKDDAGARKWYQAAANAGNAEAAEKLKQMDEAPPAPVTTAEQIKRGSQLIDKALALLDKDGGRLDSNTGLAIEAWDEAGGLLKKAAQTGDPEAKFVYAFYLGESRMERHRGVDHAASRAMAKSAADGGHVRAMLRMGYDLENGIHGRQDQATALAWFEKAGWAGSAEGWSAAGKLVFHPYDGPCDFVRAKGYWEKAAALGDAGAMFSLGRLYGGNLWGEDTPKRLMDKKLAREWLDRAEKAGHPKKYIDSSRKELGLD